MKPPERLLDDASIEPDLREALRVESAREVSFDVAAGLARLQAAIDAPPVPPAAEAATSAGLKLKLLLGGGAAIGAALLGFALTRQEPALAPAPVAAPREAPAPVARLERPTRVVTPPVASSAEPIAPAPPPPSAKVFAPPVDKEARIAEEIRHLGEVRQLAASNPAAAAKKADEGHARFKGGMLYQEREAVAITSLARAGRSAEARARGTRFLQVFPKSPFADQIRSATGIAP